MKLRELNPPFFNFIKLNFLLPQLLLNPFGIFFFKNAKQECFVLLKGCELIEIFVNFTFDSLNISF